MKPSRLATLIRIYETQVIFASRKSHKIRIYEDFIEKLKELEAREDSDAGQ